MSKKTSNSKNKDNMNTGSLSIEKLISVYTDFVATNGRDFNSILELAKKVEAKESEIYKLTNSLKSLRKLVAKETVARTVLRISAANENNEENTASFRESLLTFQFCWVEELTEIRSYIKVINKLYCGEFFSFIVTDIKDLLKIKLEQAKISGEVPDRPLVSKYYPELFSKHLKGVLKFWLDDESLEFSSTDAAIEKSTNFWCDSVGSTAFDSGFDFAKFLLTSQNKFNGLDSFNQIISDTLSSFKNFDLFNGENCNPRDIVNKAKSVVEETLNNNPFLKFINKCKNSCMP